MEPEHDGASAEEPVETVEVAVVGGGPAGLSAAIWLARVGRSVVVLDGGVPRNRATWAVHGFPGLPDLTPDALGKALRQQAEGAGARIRECTVAGLEGARGGFRLRTSEGERIEAERALLAFGLRDALPAIPEAEALYGTSLFHCPDCDGPSARGARVGVLGVGKPTAALALLLRYWAGDLVLLTNGEAAGLTPEQSDRLQSKGIAVREERIATLHQRAGRLREVVLEGGASLPLECLFFRSKPSPSCGLGEALGCSCDEEGHLVTDRSAETTVPGIYAAGDITGHPYLAVSAAAEGVRAALSIHRSLLPDDCKL